MKMFFKKNIKTCVVIVLMLAVIITGATAFLSASDSKENVFTVGAIDLELIEEGWTQSDNPNFPNEYINISNENMAVVPGTIIEKAPYIKNTGNTEAWVYMTVGVPTVTTYADWEGYPRFPLHLSSDELKLSVKAYGIQDGYEKQYSSLDIWNTYFDAEEIFGVEMTVGTTDRTELFSMITEEVVNSFGLGWELISETPYFTAGYNYYTFAYQTKLQPGKTTSPIFENVQYNENISEININDGICLIYLDESEEKVFYYTQEGSDYNPFLNFEGCEYGGTIEDCPIVNNKTGCYFESGYVAAYSNNEWALTNYWSHQVAAIHSVPTELFGKPLKNELPELDISYIN